MAINFSPGISVVYTCRVILHSLSSLCKTPLGREIDIYHVFNFYFLSKHLYKKQSRFCLEINQVRKEFPGS